MHRIKRWFLLILVATLGTAVVTATPTADVGAIAYARMDNSGRYSSLHTILPDGNNGRTLHTIGPTGSISEVAWSPNGQEIAFAASDEAAYSIFNQDIFGVRPTGTNLRRISNPPQFAGLPGGRATGTVTGTLRNNSGRNNVSIISLYIQGATSGFSIPFFNHLDQVSFSLDVADMGQGELQYLVLSWADGMGGPYKEFTVGFVDVLPGQTVNMGMVDFVGSTFQPELSDLSWNHTGTELGFLLTNGNPAPWQIAAVGEVAGRPLANVPLLSTLAMAPTENIIAYYRVVGSEGVIALNQVGGTLATEQIILNDAMSSLNFDRHLAWLPDGSGLVITVNGEIFDYILATQQVRQLTNFGGGVQVDRVSVSPDGRTIVFGASTTPNQSDLYLLDRQTAGFPITQLTHDGRSGLPNWSRVNPPTTHVNFLPFIGR